MNFTISKPEIDIMGLCQKIDYEPLFEDRSYIKPLGKDDYPRFHLFVEQKENELKFKLHLDRRGNDEHESEYESERLTEEVNRIKEIIFSEFFQK